MALSRKGELFSLSCFYYTFVINHPLICGYMDSIYYLSDMDDVDKRMEHEIDSGEVAHAKAVGTSFGKHCSKYKYNSKHCQLTI